MSGKISYYSLFSVDLSKRYADLKCIITWSSLQVAGEKASFNWLVVTWCWLAMDEIFEIHMDISPKIIEDYWIMYYQYIVDTSSTTQLLLLYDVLIHSPFEFLKFF